MKTTRSQAALRWLVLLISAGLVFMVDQITKALVTRSLSFGETWVPVAALEDFLVITRSANTGAALGLLPQAGDIFLAVALVMIVVILVYYPRMAGGRWPERIGLGLLLGGAAGNALDRIRLGYVVDFVHFQLKPLISNVSNIADHAIVIGIAILFLAQWSRGRQPRPQPEYDHAAPPELRPDEGPPFSDSAR